MDYNLQIGHLYKYDIDIESREYSERWYTDVKAWRIDSSNNDKPLPLSPLDMEGEDDNSNLPF